MKQTIVIVSLVALLTGVVMYGAWYIYEQYEASRFERELAQTFGNASIPEEQEIVTTQVETQVDPFGLFGSETAEYTIRFNALWSEFTHGENYSLSAHFSDPVLWVGTGNPVFGLGQPATRGIEEMAETGITRELKKELEELQEVGSIESFEIQSRVASPGSDSYTVVMDADQPVLSLVSMIAPSPDWFVAVDGLSMIVDGRWRDDFEIILPLLDAGTEEGDKFRINNEASIPAGVIRPVDDIDTSLSPPFASLSINRVQQNRESGE